MIDFSAFTFKDIVIPIAVSIVVAWYTAKFTLRRDQQHGMARLLEICRRYVLNFYNAFNKNTSKLRTDQISYQMYVQELERIVRNLDDLLGNAYVEKLILKYPRVTMVLFQLRQELVELKAQGTSLQSLNPGSIAEVFDLLGVLQVDLGRSMGNTEFDRSMKEIEVALQKHGIIVSRKGWGSSVPGQTVAQ